MVTVAPNRTSEMSLEAGTSCALARRAPVSDLECRGGHRRPIGRSLGSGVCRARFGNSGFDLGHALFHDQVWMLGRQPIRQVLDGVGVLFLHEGSAHVGVKLTGFREGSPSIARVEVSQAQDYAFLPAGSPPALILRAFQIVFLRHAIRSCFRVFALGDN